MFTFIIPKRVNDPLERFSKNIERSDIYKCGRYEFRVKEGYTNVRQAINDGLSPTPTSKYLVFCHEDVYMPEDFEEKLIGSILYLEQTNPNFGVLGFAGVAWKRNNFKKVFACSVNDRGVMYGYRVDEKNEIVEVETLDELCFITKNEDWVTFDQDAPTRHLYGVELCLKATSLGKKNYVIPPHIFHNANIYSREDLHILKDEFKLAAAYLKSKHPEYFPFASTCGEFE